MRFLLHHLSILQSRRVPRREENGGKGMRFKFMYFLSSVHISICIGMYTHLLYVKT
jgi:hypothetical protein